MNLILCEYLHLVEQIFATSSFLTFWTKLEVHLHLSKFIKLYNTKEESTICKLHIILKIRHMFYIDKYIELILIFNKIYLLSCFGYSFPVHFVLFCSFIAKKKKQPTDCDQLSWFDYTSLMGHNPCDLKNIVNNNILCMQKRLLNLFKINNKNFKSSQDFQQIENRPLQLIHSEVFNTVSFTVLRRKSNRLFLWLRKFQNYHLK